MTTPASHRAAHASGSSRPTSPYLIGAAIGLLNIGAFAAFRKGIGVSSAYESGAALVPRKVAPDALHVKRKIGIVSRRSADTESCIGHTRTSWHG